MKHLIKHSFWIDFKNKRTIYLFFFLIFSDISTYELKPAPIDVVIPCHVKDLDTLLLSIDGIRQNLIGVRRVIVVSSKRLTDRAEWFDESLYPFSKKDIDSCGVSGQPTSWVYQQLLKLYAPFVIAGISSNVFILDADTIFLNPISFLQKSGAGYMNYVEDIHKPYRAHIESLIPWINLHPHYSGVTHCMLFQKEILEDLFNQVEGVYAIPFWEAFCKSISNNWPSEYDLYFNFAQAFSDQVKLKKLFFGNVTSLAHLATWKKHKYIYVSAHAYMRGRH